MPAACLPLLVKKKNPILAAFLPSSAHSALVRPPVAVLRRRPVRGANILLPLPILSLLLSLSLSGATTAARLTIPIRTRTKTGGRTSRSFHLFARREEGSERLGFLPVVYRRRSIKASPTWVPGGRKCNCHKHGSHPTHSPKLYSKSGTSKFSKDSDNAGF